MAYMKERNALGAEFFHQYKALFIALTEQRISSLIYSKGHSK